MSNPEGIRTALQLIAREADERTGTLDLGKLGLTSLPEELWELRDLRCLILSRSWQNEGSSYESSNLLADNNFAQGLPLLKLPKLEALFLSSTSLIDLSPLAELHELRILNCSYNPVTHLLPLAGLNKLRSLNCSLSLVNDLDPLAKLHMLRELDFCFTSVSDLMPLRGLRELRMLECSYTPVKNLMPLEDLNELHTLSCSYTSISELSPLAKLHELQILKCSGTSVARLDSIAKLLKLGELKCYHSLVRDLWPLANLHLLRKLDFSNTSVNELSPLIGLNELRELNCSGTSVTNLMPLEELPNLESITASFCKLNSFPTTLLKKPTLKNLFLCDTDIPGIPTQALSQTFNDNCCERLRGHLDDLEYGVEHVTDVKVIVLGNGRIGKTQICNRLRGESYVENADSTHGVLVTECKLCMSGDTHDATLNIWDFGGQELYHGTHALFLNTQSIFILIWTPESENTLEYDHEGMTYRNQSLAYWLNFIRHTTEAGCPVVVVQNQCDNPDDEKFLPPELFQGLGYVRQVHYSAKENRNRNTLNEALQEAVRWFRRRESIDVIGSGRMKVRRQIQQWINEDRVRDSEHKKHQLLTLDEFHSLCIEAGGVKSPDSLLEYLHNTGVVFYRNNIFDGQIVIDQNWALKAIYSVLHRRRCCRPISLYGGRFTPTLLNDLIWEEEGYTQEEQSLFISMMKASGVCFALQSGIASRGIENEYLVPDLLPERNYVVNIQKRLVKRWDDEDLTEERVWQFAFLPPSIMRALLLSIGARYGPAAVYWKTGVWFMDEKLKSCAIIDQIMENASQGRIIIRTQGLRKSELLKSIANTLGNVLSNLGPGTFIVDSSFPHAHDTRIQEYASLKMPQLARSSGEEHSKVNVDAAHSCLQSEHPDQRIEKWFKPLDEQIGWSYWVGFWYIGFFDYPSIINEGVALGYRSVQVKMANFMEESKLGDLSVSAKHCENSVKYVNDYLREHPFLDDRMLLSREWTDIRPCLNPHNKSSGSKWSYVAGLVWTALTTYLRPKNRPGIQRLIVRIPKLPGQ